MSSGQMKKHFQDMIKDKEQKIEQLEEKKKKMDF